MAELVQQNPVVPLDIQGIAIRKAALLEADQRQKDRAIEEQTAAEQRRILGEVAKTPLIQDPQTGQWVMDRNTLMQKFGGVIPKPLRDMFDEDDKHVSTVHAAQEASLASGARRVVAAGNDPSIWNQTLDYWEKNHVLSSEEAKHYRTLTDPKQIGTVAAQLSGQKPGEGDFTLNSPGAPDARFRAGESTPYATGMAAQPKPDEPVFATDPTKRTVTQIGTVPANAHIVAQPQPQAAAAGPGGTGALTEEGVDYAATQYRVTGVMPPMGMGNSQARAAIINAAARQAKQLGQNPAMAIQKQAAYKADSGSLTKMTAMRSSAEAFETKALAQADIVQDLSDKVSRTSIPLINSALLAGKKDIGGDTNTQLLYNSLSTFTTEYAKIMEGSTGSVAASSESARKQASELISAALSKGTLRATVDLMKREMALTIDGYDATIGHITQRMGGSPAATGVAVHWVYDPVTKTFKKGGG